MRQVVLIDYQQTEGLIFFDEIGHEACIRILRHVSRKQRLIFTRANVAHDTIEQAFSIINELP